MEIQREISQTTKDRPYWDISARDDLSNVKGAFERAGFLVFRNILDTKLMSEISSRLNNEFETLFSKMESLPENLTMHLKRNEVPADPELAKFRLQLESYSHLTSSERLYRALSTVTGKKFFWHYPAMFRKMDPTKTKGLLPFHQDYTYNSKYRSCFVCWVPFVDCGSRAPSLTMVEKYLTERYDHAADGYWEYGMNDSQTESLVGDCKRYNLALKAGDVVLFNDLTIHKTFWTPEMDQSRWSMDARFVTRDQVGDEVWQKRKFIEPNKQQFTEDL